MAAARRDQAPNMEVFDAYFRRADLDQDGRISGHEAVAFFQGSNLSKPVLAQIWMHADQNRTGFLGRPEFYNALKLVTVAQSGRELTPDIVKAALFGPAAAKIPAPQINPVSLPAAQANSMPSPTPQSGSAVPPSTQMSGVPPTSHNLGLRGPHALPNVGMIQQVSSSLNNQFMRPHQAVPSAGLLPLQGASQGVAGVGNATGSRPLNSSTQNLSTDWFGGRAPGGLVGGATLSGAAPGLPPKPQTPTAAAASVSSKPLDPLSSFQPSAKDSKALVPSGNGFSSNSACGGSAFSATQAKPDTLASTFSASSMPTASSTPPVNAGSQNSTKPVQVDPFQSFSTIPHGGGQLQQAQSPVKQNQPSVMQSTLTLSASNNSVEPAGSSANQAQLQWPKITQSDVKKYTNVFVEVDKDRDGKITGDQARNLFLSWRLPREVLKQVWDLSDEDNDSMLSLREFCIALYLMERYREGRPLPAALPNTLRFDETLLRATGQPSTAYVAASWQTSPGFPQQGVPGPRPVMPVSGLRPPMQTSVASPADGAQQPSVPKSRDVFENLVNQPNKEQGMQNSKLQDATHEDNKVQEVEKILDSREKVEFYRTRMQELVLYKSRCDNRLNEITERASADKREVETLAKKYEEKYKQVSEVASKLTVEEATFRDIQARKLELHNAIIKMEQGGSVDGLLQVRADRIQSDFEELAKFLNERCKQHGLQVKSTASIELPFGWQPDIQEGAADWDEEWDKFEDEGFLIAKDLSIVVQNDATSEKSKSPSAWSENEVSPAASASHVYSNAEKPYRTGEQVAESESTYAQSEDGSAKSPSGSPRRSAFESPSQEFHSPMHDISPHAKDSHSDHGGDESTFGDKYADDAWGANFDTNDDMDSVWGFNSKDTGQDSFFGSGDFGLNPIKVDSPSAGSEFGKKRSSFFADSVPSSPLFNSSSPQRFNEGRDIHSFDASSRFDSFSTRDSGLFQQRESLARFDSVRSTSDFHSRSGFSFDDSDPFGSTGPFKSTESHSPRKGSDSWSAF